MPATRGLAGPALEKNVMSKLFLNVNYYFEDIFENTNDMQGSVLSVLTTMLVTSHIKAHLC